MRMPHNRYRPKSTREKLEEWLVALRDTVGFICLMALVAFILIGWLG